MWRAAVLFLFAALPASAADFGVRLYGARGDGVTNRNGYSDGLDPDASRFVRIADTYIDCYDDANCPKASPSMGMENRRSVENLTVANCVRFAHEFS